MKAAKIPLQKAQEEKKRLFKCDAIDTRYKPKKEGNFFYIPLKKEITGYEMVEMQETPKEKKTIQEILREIIPKEELPTAYDVIGTILIFESKNKKHEKEIAEAYLKCNKNIKTVAKKVGIHKGEFRTQKIKILAGENTKVTTHKENGVNIKLNVEKVYFSPRTGTERLRIAKLTKKNEKILVCFAGCAPFPLVIKKINPTTKITAIELNPIACKYAKENCKKTDIKIIQGDVTTDIPKETYDRIIMPLPKRAEEFLETIKEHCKKGTMIHMYAFNIDQTEEEIKNRIEKNHRWIKVQKITKCGEYGPGINRLSFDCKTK